MIYANFTSVLGTIMHSHYYRVPDPYKCRRVLVIGAGPSGMDISLDIAEVSKTLIHSHHSAVNFRTPFPSHYIKKPDVKEFHETGATFVDGSFEELDDVLYCTG
jgi:dimethylaniline monooxygenase (N-oxide forming)